MAKTLKGDDCDDGGAVRTAAVSALVAVGMVNDNDERATVGRGKKVNTI